LRMGADPVQPVISKDFLTFLLLLTTETVINVVVQSLRPSPIWVRTEELANLLLGGMILLFLLRLIVRMILDASASVLHDFGKLHGAYARLRIAVLTNQKDVAVAQAQLKREREATDRRAREAAGLQVDDWSLLETLTTRVDRHPR